MINLFQFAADDKSLTYLVTIFGTMNGIIAAKTAAGGSISGVSVTILGTMFSIFNSVILAIAALMVVYITVVGVMMTAHEGEFMKQWNSLWMPVRVVLGIAALVPTGSGYSGLQMLMMWVIVQGIGAADVVWTTSLNYIQNMGSIQAQATVSNVGMTQNLSFLFQGLVCDASARRSDPNPFSRTTTIDEGGYYCNAANRKRDKSFCSSGNVFNPNSGSYQMGPNGACGTVTYCSQTTVCAVGSTASMACEVCKAQVGALAAIISTFSGIAGQFVNADYNYQQYYYASFNPNNDQTPPDQLSWLSTYCTDKGLSVCAGQNLVSPGTPGANASAEVVSVLYWPYAIKPIVNNVNFIDTASSYYGNAIGAAANAYITLSPKDEMQGVLQEARDAGWLFAGGYYNLIAKVNNASAKSSIPTLSVAPMIGSQDSPLYSYRINFDAADYLLNDAAGSAAQANAADGKVNVSFRMSPTSTSGMKGMDKMVGPATDVLDTSFSAMSGSLDDSSLFGLGGTNPIIQAQSLGNKLILAVEIAYPILLVIIIVLGALGFLSPFVLGTGVTNPVGGMGILVGMLLFPLIFALFGILIFYGSLLAVYVPLIPYIIFTFGAIGWFLAVVEAMAAGPLVALGILSPGGHSLILGKAEPALSMLLSIFLRPSLMIFGLIAGSLLAAVFVSMVNQLFVTNLMKDIGGSSPVILILMLGVYVGLVVTVVNKSFSTIHILPDRVLGWISGQTAHSEKGMEELAQTKSGVEGSARGMAGGAEKTAEGAKSSAGEFARGQQHKKESDKKAKQAAGSPNISGDKPGSK